MKRKKNLKKKVAPFGSWKSPITTDLIVEKSIQLGEIIIDHKDIYWSESRPYEGGRNVIVRMRVDGEKIDLIPPPFNARTRVHEYGGGSFTVKDGSLYFSNFEDQRIYRKLPGKNPEPITPEGNLRYADGIIDKRRKCLICVREDHRNKGISPINTLVSIDLEGNNNAKVLVSGNDFYSSPRLDHKGNQLMWLTWNHPNMPWDGNELWVGELKDNGSIGKSKKVAGSVNESIFQPEWSCDGVIYFISDRNGWWNLYRLKEGKIENVVKMKAEFGKPQWVFGLSTYGFDSEGNIICSYTKEEKWNLAHIDLSSGDMEKIKIPYSYISLLKVEGGRAVFTGGSWSRPMSLVKIDLSTLNYEVLQSSTKLSVDPGYLSFPEAISFPTEENKKAYGLYYPPKNKDYTSPPKELPPLIVTGHGGPTSSTSSTLSLPIQFWSSRGFAVLDVNYGGSTGYGREYRKRLNHKWGIVDIDDCVNGARYLVERGKVDKDRLIIRGGSAGGYTTLSALTFRNFFKAGASYYGISDLESLAKETHKFESHYLDGLIGPYPDKRKIYQERSPIKHTNQLSSPVIFFQGLEDKIVPPAQSESLVSALRKKGLPVAYISFKGEQHGFRREENIKRALEAELYFYSRIFGFKLGDRVKPVDIENL